MFVVVVMLCGCGGVVMLCGCGGVVMLCGCGCGGVVMMYGYSGVVMVVVLMVVMMAGRATKRVCQVVLVDDGDNVMT